MIITSEKLDKTFENLISQAQAHGLRYECSTLYIDLFGERINFPKITLSIEEKDFVWFTWTINYDRDQDWNLFLDPFVWFEERYNQINGSSMKSWRKESTLLNRLGIKSY